MATYNEKESRTEAAAFHPMSVVHHLTEAVPDLVRVVVPGIAITSATQTVPSVTCQARSKLHSLSNAARGVSPCVPGASASLSLGRRMGFESAIHNVPVPVLLPVSPEWSSETSWPVRGAHRSAFRHVRRAGALGMCGSRAGAGY